MPDNKITNIYDDDDIPPIDLPGGGQNKNSVKNGTNPNNRVQNSVKSNYNVDPLPESERPRKDGPGGE